MELTLRKLAHAINREFSSFKIENFQLKKFDICGEAVLTSTHNLCFGAKIRKIGIPLHTPVLQYKSGVFKEGIHSTDMFSRCAS